MRSTERIEQLLTTIDILHLATIKHLRGIHDLKSYRNACKVLRQLEPYTFVTYWNKQKVFYLNKLGRDMIGSNKEVKRNQNLEHTLLRNDVYIYLNKPITWQTEAEISYSVPQQHKQLGIIVKGVSSVTKTRVIADAKYTRNGYTHLVEIDNSRHMPDNLKKIKAYAECFKHLDTPRLEIFTTSLTRKRKFETWLKEYTLRGEVFTYEEINL